MSFFINFGISSSFWCETFLNTKYILIKKQRNIYIYIYFINARYSQNDKSHLQRMEHALPAALYIFYLTVQPLRSQHSKTNILYLGSQRNTLQNKQRLKLSSWCGPDRARHGKCPTSTWTLPDLVKGLGCIHVDLTSYLFCGGCMFHSYNISVKYCTRISVYMRERNESRVCGADNHWLDWRVMVFLTH